MRRSPGRAELRAAAPHLPLVLFDGECVFCTAQAQRLRALSRGRLRVEPLQSALPHVPWVDPDDAILALHLVDRDGRSYAGAAAVVRALRLSRPLLGALVLPYHLPGVRWLAERLYAWVARRRYRVAGRRMPTDCSTGACGVPWAERPAGHPADGWAGSAAAAPAPAPAPAAAADAEDSADTRQSTSSGRPAASNVRSSTPPSSDSSQRE